MIARMIVASNPGPWISPGAGAPVVGISPGAVVIAGVGDCAAIPIFGLSPAVSDDEEMHVRATANMKRFMGVAPYLRSNHVNLCTSPKIRPIPQHFLQGRPQRSNIAFALVLLHFL